MQITEPIKVIQTMMYTASSSDQTNGELNMYRITTCHTTNIRIKAIQRTVTASKNLLNFISSMLLQDKISNSGRSGGTMLHCREICFDA